MSVLLTKEHMYSVYSVSAIYKRVHVKFLRDLYYTQKSTYAVFTVSVLLTKEPCTCFPDAGLQRGKMTGRRSSQVSIARLSDY